MEDRWGMPTSGAEDRLAALRQPKRADQQQKVNPQRAARFVLSREVVLGVILLLIGAVVAVMMVGGNSPVTTTADPAVTSVPSQAGSTELTRGQAYFAALVQPGAYPPGIAAGDSVVVVVTPQSSSDGSTRMLQDVVHVVDVESPEEATAGVVVTLLGPELVVRDIADSGSVHLAIVKRGN